MFWDRWSKPEKLAARLSQLVSKESGCSLDQISVRIIERRKMMDVLETVLTLDHRASHSFEFDLEAAGRGLSVTVDVECDRDNPMGLLIEAETRFRPAAPILFARPGLWAKFLRCEPEDEAQLKRDSNIISLMKRCVRNSYHNISFPNAQLSIEPVTPTGSAALSLCRGQSFSGSQTNSVSRPFSSFSSTSMGWPRPTAND